MPPQQSHGLLGGIEERFNFGAHQLISQEWQRTTACDARVRES